MLLILAKTETLICKWIHHHMLLPAHRILVHTSRYYMKYTYQLVSHLLKMEYQIKPTFLTLGLKDIQESLLCILFNQFWLSWKVNFLSCFERILWQTLKPHYLDNSNNAFIIKTEEASMVYEFHPLCYVNGSVKLSSII